jgi:hypothetical protein
VPGTLEYTIHRIVEERIDTSIFDEKYHNDETGRCAYPPKVLLKIVLFAYSRGILHSRRMERACKENIIFMALACGQTPDHSTLAAFVSEMGEETITASYITPKRYSITAKVSQWPHEQTHNEQKSHGSRQVVQTEGQETVFRVSDCFPHHKNAFITEINQAGD